MKLFCLSKMLAAIITTLVIYEKLTMLPALLIFNILFNYLQITLFSLFIISTSSLMTTYLVERPKRKS